MNDVINPTIASDLGLKLGVNELPYAVPIHPMLVHFTIGLFIVAVLFDGLGALYGIRKSLGLRLNIGRSTLFDIGWWNIASAALCTFVTVIFGYFEIALASPPVGVKSPWGFTASQTMLMHGVGGLTLLGVLVLLAIWRGFQRYRWRKGKENQVQWSYLLAGAVTLGLMFFQGELGAHMSADFGIHNTAVQILRAPEDSPLKKCDIRTNCL